MKNQLPDFSWVNGCACSTVSITDRGLQYGDGLFETLLYHQGRVVLEQEHFARLLRDSQRLGLRLDKSLLQHEFSRFSSMLEATHAGSGVIKIVLTRQFTGRSYAPDPRAQVNRIFHFYRGVRYPQAHRQGVALALSSQRLSRNPALAGMKHLNRLEQVLAQSALPKPLLRGLAFAEALLLDPGGHVIEGISSNIFMVKSGHLLTPRLENAGVRGVMRDYLLQQVAHELEIPFSETNISLGDLLQADEVFVCNSVYGIWPVTALEVRQWKMGPLTQNLQDYVDKHGYAEIHG